MPGIYIKNNITVQRDTTPKLRSDGRDRSANQTLSCQPRPLPEKVTVLKKSGQRTNDQDSTDAEIHSTATLRINEIYKKPSQCYEWQHKLTVHSQSKAKPTPQFLAETSRLAELSPMPTHS